MRLHTFLNETLEDDIDVIIDKIRKDCKPFLNEFDKPLYRGVTNEYDFFIKKDVRTNRVPKNTKPYISDSWNKGFQKRFGWKARSEGLFVLQDPDYSGIYGDTRYVVFPIGHYKYIYAPTVYDLFTEPIPDNDELIYKFIDINYKDSELNKHNVLGEIVFKCDSYYGIKYRDSKTTVILKKLGFKI